MLIFGVGGGVSAYEGVLHLMRPSPIENAFWSYLTLGIAFLFEGATFIVAVRQFRREQPGPFWRALRSSKDPTTYTVMAEDGAALAGLVAAAIGIFASAQFGVVWLDGAASVVIGLILAGVALMLVHQARGLLVGEPATAEGIRELARETPGVRTVGRPLSMYIGPEEVLLALDVGFDPDVSADDVASSVRKLERAIREKYTKIKRIYIEARSPEEMAQ